MATKSLINGTPEHLTAGAGRGKISNYRRLTDPKAEQKAAYAARKKWEDDIDEALIMDRSALPTENEQDAARSALQRRIMQADKDPSADKSAIEDPRRYAKGGRVTGFKGYGRAKKV